MQHWILQLQWGRRMVDSNIDKELTAIKAIIGALTELDADARQRVLGYAIVHLQIILAPNRVDPTRVDQFEHSRQPIELAREQDQIPSRLHDIRSLKAEKRPSSDVEMATVVAFYLKTLAPEDERRDTVGAEDIEKYFVQAGYPLPSDHRYTLPNAKKSGYLESAERGRYKLNSVGHNLVVHGLPRSVSSSAEGNWKKTHGKGKR